MRRLVLFGVVMALCVAALPAVGVGPLTATPVGVGPIGDDGTAEIGAFDPVLALERTTFDPEDQPFEYVRSAYRGDRYRVALDLRAPEGP